MKNLYLLDELLSAASPTYLPRPEILEALQVGAHQLWILTSMLRAEYDRVIESNHFGIRYPTPPAIPLYVEFLSGVTRLSRGTKRLLVEDALNNKILTVTVKRKLLRILPFYIADDAVVAAETPEGGVVRRCGPLHLDAIDAVVAIRKFQGDSAGLRGFLGL
jgi:hypothetical protein